MSSFLINRHLIRHFSIQRKLLQQIQLKVSNPGSVVPVFTNASNYADKIALTDSFGTYTYGNLFLSAKELSKEIRQKVNGRNNERIMFLCPNDANYIITLWAIWMAGQIAVPISPLHPKNILLYYANDTKAKLLVTAPNYVDLMQNVSTNTSINLYVLDDKLKLNATEKAPANPEDWDAGMEGKFYERNNALILYTSGTTGNPKGVVLTHKNLVNQINTLVEAWKWNEYDSILHTLPLHHVHGIVNALLCPLYVGAKTVMLEKFDPKIVWSNLLGVGTTKSSKITVFMAVPTIYHKLIDEYDNVFKNDRKMIDYIKRSLKQKVRLMVSGSAPLPNQIFERWHDISGHKLLERYGMTETGMCLSNLYDAQREPGYVGVPLPGVSVRIVDENYKVLLECTNTNGNVIINKKITIGPIGELLVKSGGVFKEYYNRPETTKSEFTIDGWFKTGDISEYVEEKKLFKIVGRKNSDIIKSGGYKVGALMVESQLLDHPNIKECAIVGVDDPIWGQRVAACIVLKDKENVITLDDIREWAKERLPIYALPTLMEIVDTIPRNAMGKVNKKELVKTVFDKKID